MQITCGCSECGVRFKVDAKYAGRRIQCPKCSAPCPIPQVANSGVPGQSSQSSKPAAKKPAPKKPVPQKPAPARRGGSSVAPVVAAPSVGDEFDFGSLGQETATSSSAYSSSAPSSSGGPDKFELARARRAKNNMMIVGGSIAAGALVLIGLVVMLVMPSGSSDGKLVLELSDAARKNASIKIDGKLVPLSANTSLEFALKPGEHRINLTRPGYSNIDKRITVKAGETVPLTPTWYAFNNFENNDTLVASNDPKTPSTSKPPTKNNNKQTSNSGKKPDDKKAPDKTSPNDKGFAQPKPGDGFTQPGEASPFGGWEPPETRKKKKKPQQQQQQRPGETVLRGLVIDGKRIPVEFGAWTQNLEEAKSRAQSEDKDLFIVFLQSDEISHLFSLADVMFGDLTSTLKKDYILVALDFPTRGKSMLENPPASQSNGELRKDYGAKDLPFISIADKHGLPYGVLLDVDFYENEEIVDYLKEAKKHRDAREEFVTNINSSEGLEKLQAAKKLVQWLQEKDEADEDGESRSLFRYVYRPLFGKWHGLSKKEDPSNEHGLQEIFFELDWMMTFFDTSYATKKEREKIINDQLAILSTWEKKHQFKDAEIGGRIHLVCAQILASLERTKDAEKHLAAGLAYQPKDKEVARALSRGKANINRAGTGSGFVVAPGYVMTNHHVIEGEGDVVVLVKDPKSGKQIEVPAKVTAKDKDRDMAILKLDLPKHIKLNPLTVSSDDQRRGTSVGVFGYPLGDALGGGLKLTRGIISSTPEEANNRMLVLDCRVNPGNSGGPLCDQLGNVIGLVSAKFGRISDDSYGLALPANEVVSFMEKNIPQFKPVRNTTKQRQEWVDLDAQITPSVLMIVKLKEA